MTKSPLPIVLSRPHGGLGVPEEIKGRLAIDEISLYNECDLWIDKLFDFSSPELESLLPSEYEHGTLGSVAMPIARGLIDVNRPLRMLGKPDGPIKTRTSYGEQIYHAPLPDTLNQTLVQRYWQDYHDRISEVLRLNLGHVKLIIDCHNMAQLGPTKYRDAGRPRPLICVSNLGDSDGNARSEFGWLFCPREVAQAATQAAEELFQDMELLEPVSDTPPPIALLNQPFSGSYVIAHHLSPDTIQQEYIDKGIKPPMRIMVEVNRGLYVGNQSKATKIMPPNEERISEIRQRLYRWALRLLDLVEAQF